MSKINRQGGFVPRTKEELDRAKANDLLTLPIDVIGTNCLNCKFVSPTTTEYGMCLHPKVRQPITNRMCCALWDANGTIRPLEKVKTMLPENEE